MRAAPARTTAIALHGPRPTGNADDAHPLLRGPSVPGNVLSPLWLRSPFILESNPRGHLGLSRGPKPEHQRSVALVNYAPATSSSLRCLFRGHFHPPQGLCSSSAELRAAWRGFKHPERGGHWTSSLFANTLLVTPSRERVGITAGS